MKSWYACAEPERPTDAAVLWHYEGCLACALKADALEWQYPDDPHVQWLRSMIGDPFESNMRAGMYVLTSET